MNIPKNASIVAAIGVNDITKSSNSFSDAAPYCDCFLLPDKRR